MNNPKKYVFNEEEDEVNLANMAREGVSFYRLTKLSEYIQLGMQEWAEYLHLSERTMQRYKKEGKTFDPIYSEKIIIIELLYKKGINIFGIKDNFYTWMDTVSVALGGVKPKDMLDTNFGITMVYDELGRIEHGIFA
ncbi:antitoxin Xre/MbcA/ParS toxin-binding domain-containing protein [Mucilaginibacter sp. OK098]|uniref:type II RES/Xre toxin-antitoxin system antitoxin n=1 Tax=Mucilaginibacter sp. OK098 TaxID=1855297 RepID=UPI0009104C04|nr:antitoxin Xre/MbcA/ParS toxin-binding domain-containing protein [Mucilaginibacter sp. OK098]SHN16578.1 putative toxin-antitoxin system antitoxin component, TIGR02293 family [Mucilaginibacter sp. OK098]